VGTLHSILAPVSPLITALLERIAVTAQNRYGGGSACDGAAPQCGIDAHRSAHLHFHARAKRSRRGFCAVTALGKERGMSNGIRLLPETVRPAAFGSASGIVPGRGSPSRNRRPRIGRKERTARWRTLLYARPPGTTTAPTEKIEPQKGRLGVRKNYRGLQATLFAPGKESGLFCFDPLLFRRRTAHHRSLVGRAHAKPLVAPAKPAVERLRNKMRGVTVPARSITGTDTPLRSESQANAA